MYLFEYSEEVMVDLALGEVNFSYEFGFSNSLDHRSV
jgi:hypothetical protein